MASNPDKGVSSMPFQACNADVDSDPMRAVNSNLEEVWQPSSLAPPLNNLHLNAPSPSSLPGGPDPSCATVPVLDGNCNRRSTQALASLPLVSCIMPTRGRPYFVLQSIRYFQQQDYANRELIILDDSEEDLAPLLPPDPRIRYERVSGNPSIGAKRNRACRLARGSIIAQWDDDDWYASDRLSIQVHPLLNDTADISGLYAITFFDLVNWKFWRCTSALHARLFVGDVAGGTLVFARKLWEQGAQYPDASLAEDAGLLRRALADGARLARLPGESHFLYTRHDANTWRFPCGEHLDSQGWHTLKEPDLPAADRAFYRGYSGWGRHYNSI